MTCAFYLIQINVLLQAYISQLKLEGFALVSDMVFVTQVCKVASFCVCYVDVSYLWFYTCTLFLVCWSAA